VHNSDSTPHAYISYRLYNLKRLILSVATSKITISRYRPRVDLGVLRGLSSRISRKSAHKCGKVFSPTHRPSLPIGTIAGTHFCWSFEATQGPQCDRNNYYNTGKFQYFIGNRTRDIPVCSALPQPTAPPRTPFQFSSFL
jgi:hypothetical protein